MKWGVLILLLRWPLSHQKHTQGNLSSCTVLLLGNVSACYEGLHIGLRISAHSTESRAAAICRGPGPPQVPSLSSICPRVEPYMGYSSAAVVLPGNSWPSVAFKFLKKGNRPTEVTEESTEEAGTLPPPPPHPRGGDTIVLLPRPPQRK